MAKNSIRETNAPHQVTIHWAWGLLALPGMLFFLVSDGSNNLSVVERFSSDDLSLWSWRALALACCVASAPLGCAASFKKVFWVPCLSVIVLGGLLTVLSTQTDFALRSAKANNYLSERSGLIAERNALLQSLNPTDGSKPCSEQTWCRSGDKENRVREITALLSNMRVEVNPMDTSGGKVIVSIISYLRAFGVPLIAASLGNILGLISQGLSSRLFRTPKASQTLEKMGKSQERLRKKNARKSRKTNTEQWVEKGANWVQSQPVGRINKNRMKAGVGCKSSELDLVITILLKKGILIRYQNGQLGKKAEFKLVG